MSVTKYQQEKSQKLTELIQGIPLKCIRGLILYGRFIMSAQNLSLMRMNDYPKAKSFLYACIRNSRISRRAYIIF